MTTTATVFMALVVSFILIFGIASIELLSEMKKFKVLVSNYMERRLHLLKSNEENINNSLSAYNSLVESLKKEFDPGSLTLEDLEKMRNEAEERGDIDTLIQIDHIINSRRNK